MQSLLARLNGVRTQSPDGTLFRQSHQNGDGHKLPKLSVNGFQDGDEAETIDISHKTTAVDGLSVPNLNLLNDAISDCEDKLIDFSQTDRTCDTLVIDVVMANNAGVPLSGRSIRSNISRTNSNVSRTYKASTPKSRMNSSRTLRGSKISLNSGSDGSVFADSDDETFTSRSRVSSAAQGWAAFENAVKSIDNGNPDYYAKKPKPNFVSSGTFQKVMVDMYGNSEYGNTKGYTALKIKLNKMARANGLAKQMFNSAVAKGKADREREEQEGPPEVPPEPVKDPHEVALQETAKRGWRMLKRQVNEQSMEHKLQGAKLSWTMLSHTVKQMTNTDRTRQDLYERYGIVPTKLPDGRIVCENLMLSERTRAQLYGDGKESQTSDQYNKRPSSYQPPSSYLRSRSQLSVQQRGRSIVGYNGKSAKVSHLNSRRFRPKTAK